MVVKLRYLKVDGVLKLAGRCRFQADSDVRKIFEKVKYVFYFLMQTYFKYTSELCIRSEIKLY